MLRSLLAPVLLATCAASAAAQAPIPLVVGGRVDAEIADGERHVYAADLPAGRFAYGEADQVTADVVVTVVGPDGKPVGTFDSPVRGPEPFRFTTERAGVYRIEVAPYWADGGGYGLSLRRVEPQASDPSARVDQLMAPFDGDDRPGGVVAVVRGGEVVFARGYGVADLEHGDPVTPATVFHLASLSKQLTGYAVSLLVERGALALDDDVRTYVPEVPDVGATVTIGHLLRHTSGLRNHSDLWGMAGGEPWEAFTQEDGLRLVAHQRELNHPPGEAFVYTNTGYLLLAEVVARATGEPFATWMRDHVFGPIGMSSTVVRDDPGLLIRDRARSYEAVEGGGYRRVPLLGSAVGATNVQSSAEDVARWLAVLTSGGAVVERMGEAGAIASGEPVTYGFGLGLDEHRGLQLFRHSGIEAGYWTAMEAYPEIDAGVVVLTNARLLDPARIARDVAEAFFADAMEPVELPTARPESAAPDAEEGETPWAPEAAALAAYAGRYYSPELETVYAVRVDGDRLVAAHRRHGDLPLDPLEPDVFGAREWFLHRVRFERDAGDSVVALRASTSRARDIRFERW